MKKFYLVLLAIIALTGCQAEQTVQTGAEKQPQQKIEKNYVDHGLPASNGPTSAPEEMKGPTTPPPSSDAPKVITTDEKIRLTLPIKTE
ncbi:membrane lipoprotein lipid attachment site-containing protein [Candidatus Peregrinibacteria bacterium]|nr:membrane lipoprotein lipid attachment site-containing protein [Candidatus Peregrinibacteria bacterium]